MQPELERPAASCIGVEKTYFTESGRVEALQGVDAAFPRAAVSAIVGPSGSGKSSLLRILAGLDVPSAGSVLVDGTALERLPKRGRRDLRRRSVGYVFQRPSDNFVPHLTLREHLSLSRERVVSDEEVGEILATLEIDHRLEHHAHELSGGEQQRAAFAQVLMTRPALVVADEPTAELDSHSGAQLLEIVQRLAQLGGAFVLATHDSAVMEVAAHSVELDHGLLKGAPIANRSASVAMQRDLVAASDARYRARWNYLRPGSKDVQVRAPSPPVLEIAELVKTYERGDEIVHALDGVDLVLRRGEFAGLVGRSGSGKTTLLNLLSGWEEPDSGAVRWLEGAGLESVPAWDRIAVLPQKLGLMDELTVRENVAYPARLAGRLDELTPRVDRFLADLGLDELADRPPSQTSVGQQQRAALARALVLSPSLLLADEPTGHQDAGWADAVFEVLRTASSEGTTCFVATHNEEVAGRFDTVYRMADGRLAADDRMAQRTR